PAAEPALVPVALPVLRDGLFLALLLGGAGHRRLLRGGGAAVPERAAAARAVVRLRRFTDRGRVHRSVSLRRLRQAGLGSVGGRGGEGRAADRARALGAALARNSRDR